MNRFMTAVMAVAFSVTAMTMTKTPAQAQDQARLLTGDDLYPWRGWYVSVFGGVRLQPDVSSTATSIVAPGVASPFRHAFDTGFSAGVALGYSWQIGRTPWAVRVEGEYAYGRNAVDTLTAGMTLPGTGSLSSHSFMVNAYVDYRWGRLVPYIGGGIGVAIMDLNASTPAIPGATFGSGRDTNLAVQAVGGLTCSSCRAGVWALLTSTKPSSTTSSTSSLRAVARSEASMLAQSRPIQSCSVSHISSDWIPLLAR